MGNAYWLVFVLALVWPAAQLALGAARFGWLPWRAVAESLVFAPTGALSALWLAWLIRRATTPGPRLGAAIGYLVAAPLALAGSLGAGLILHPLLGAMLYALIPLVAGSTVGYWIGKQLGRAVT